MKHLIYHPNVFFRLVCTIFFGVCFYILNCSFNINPDKYEFSTDIILAAIFLPFILSLSSIVFLIFNKVEVCVIDAYKYSHLNEILDSGAKIKIFRSNSKYSFPILCPLSTGSCYIPKLKKGKYFGGKIWICQAKNKNDDILSNYLSKKSWSDELVANFIIEHEIGHLVCLYGKGFNPFFNSTVEEFMADLWSIFMISEIDNIRMNMTNLIEARNKSIFFPNDEHDVGSYLTEVKNLDDFESYFNKFKISDTKNKVKLIEELTDKLNLTDNV